MSPCASKLSNPDANRPWKSSGSSHFASDLVVSRTVEHVKNLLIELPNVWYFHLRFPTRTEWQGGKMPTRNSEYWTRLAELQQNYWQDNSALRQFPWRRKNTIQFPARKIVHLTAAISALHAHRRIADATVARIAAERRNLNWLTSEGADQRNHKNWCATPNTRLEESQGTETTPNTRLEESQGTKNIAWHRKSVRVCSTQVHRLRSIQYFMQRSISEHNPSMHFLWAGVRIPTHLNIQIYETSIKAPISEVCCFCRMTFVYFLPAQLRIPLSANNYSFVRMDLHFEEKIPPNGHGSA